MSFQHDRWQRLFFSILLLLLLDSVHLAPGQVPVAVMTPTSPEVDNKRLKGSKTSAAIKNTMEAAKSAREEGDYVSAFDSYRRVVEQLNPKDARAVYGLGIVYSDLACNDEAIKAYTKALRLDQDFRDALLALAYIYITKERYSDAELRFRAIFKKAPNDTQAKIGLAYLAGKKKQHEESLKQFQSIIDDRSVSEQDRALAYLQLGNVYLEQGKWEEASETFSKAKDHDRNLSAAYVRLAQAELFPERSRLSRLAIQEQRVEDLERFVKTAKKATEYIRTAINEYKYNHPSGNLLLANALLSQFNYAEAIESVEEFRRRVKKLEDRSSFLAAKCSLGYKQLYAWGHLTLALIYNQQSMFEKDEGKRNDYNTRVIAQAQKLIQLKPENSEGYALLGQTYFRMGNYAEAISQLEMELIYETSDEIKGATLDLIGFSHEQLRNDKEAVRAYNESLKLRPNPTSRLGLSRIRAKQGDFDEAIRLNEEAIKETKNPTASLFWHSALSYLGRARQQKRDADYEEAIELLRKALDMNQSFGPAYVTLGNVYKFYKNGARADLALVNYQQAEKYAPKDATIKCLIGDLFYSRQKNYPAAIHYLEEAIKLDPEYVSARWELAVVHREMKNNNEAIKQLRTVLELDEKYLDAYLDLADIYGEQKNYEEAIKLLRTSIDKLPLEYLPYKDLARVYSHQGKNKEAIENYEIAISRIKDDEAWFREVLRCRIVRLRGQYADSITCVRNITLPSSANPDQIPYEIGLSYVASKNKEAALAQYDELKRMNSKLAENLLRAINEMK